MTETAVEIIEAEIVEEIAEVIVDTESKPLAIVQGLPMAEIPTDLYIPPDALEIFLEMFSGPLDLLLYLIRRQNLDILNIPIAEITRQYMNYIELMRELRLDLAAEYLLMAATLAEIKSRLLLPVQVSAENPEEEIDPRAELVRRLQEYERFKQASEDLDQLPRWQRDIFKINIDVAEIPVEAAPRPTVAFAEILEALRNVISRAEKNAHHQIKLEPLSVRERMTIILTRIQSVERVPFEALFTLDEGRRGVVVTFIAILELVKQAMIDLYQDEPFSMIQVKGRTLEDNS